MRKTLCFVLLTTLAYTGPGCKLFNPHPLPPERLPDRPVADGPAALPNKYSFRIAPYVFLSDFEINKDQPLFKELAQLRDQVTKELQLPAGGKDVYVYLFENRQRYEHHMEARDPTLPKRRAYFIAQPWRVGGGEDLLVFTYWGDRIRQDLRHELTHALLHSVLKDVPLWLDEGLAEFFELPPEQKGVNDAHLDHLRRPGMLGFRPDMSRLERLSQVAQMTPAEYRESWAWAHLMLRGRPEVRKVLLAYLQQLRTNPSPGPLRPKLAAVLPDADQELVAHINRIEFKPRAAGQAVGWVER